MRFDTKNMGISCQKNVLTLEKFLCFQKWHFYGGRALPSLIKIILHKGENNDRYCVIVDAYFKAKKGLCVIAKRSFYYAFIRLKSQFKPSNIYINIFYDSYD